MFKLTKRGRDDIPSPIESVFRGMYGFRAEEVSCESMKEMLLRITGQAASHGRNGRLLINGGVLALKDRQTKRYFNDPGLKMLARELVE